MKTNTLRSTIKLWFDSEATILSNGTDFNWWRCVPFLILHLACFGVLWVGWSPFAVFFCVAFLFFRMFAITAFYHRYFAHRSFKAGRKTQFIFALLGNMAAQRGPLWWAGHHRHHHQYSDQDQDLHSPVKRGFLWSHMGWFTCNASFRTPYERISDFARFPELRFLNRFDSLIPVLVATLLYLAGEALKYWVPQLGTNGSQLLIWGFFISTTLLFHSTVTINSLAHVWGTRRFNTNDNSRNNWLLALLTLGEGWHNNHHHYPISARHGFAPWELDITYLLLKFMDKIGLIWDLKPIPARVKKEMSLRKGNTSEVSTA